MDSRREILEGEARRLGFGAVRVAAAGSTPEMERFSAFLQEGLHGGMTWLEHKQENRGDPRVTLKSCRSVVVLAMDYGQVPPPDPGGLTGQVACYAWGRDYHNVIGRRLKKLRRALAEHFPGTESWGAVDSKPVLERAWARAAGLGYIGKNCCAIRPGETSMFFLAVLLTTLPLEPDAPLGDHCGRCQRCLDACPTGAFIAGGKIDARKCISYLTIEHEGPVPEMYRPLMGRWVLGCDECQLVCPHVRPRVVGPDFTPVNAWLDLPEILASDDDTLLRRFEGSPIRRACPRRIKRSAAIVLGNLGDRAAIPALERAAKAEDPVLVEQAEWALGRLG